MRIFQLRTSLVILANFICSTTGFTHPAFKQNRIRMLKVLSDDVLIDLIIINLVNNN